MAFKVRTEERPNITRTSVMEVPAEFIALMEEQYAVVVNDPTREIVIEGDDAKEATLYVQWAKYWGLNRESKLTVTKSPSRKGGGDNLARLAVKAFDPNAVKRGRKANSN